METTKTISVEPAKITLAEKRSREIAAGLLRTNILQNEDKRNKITALNLIFPTELSGLKLYSKFTIPSRALFAALMIVAGISLFGNGNLFLGNLTPIAVLLILFGAMLAIGFMTRIATGTSAIIYFILGVLGLRNGVTDVTSFAMMFGSILFFITGAGKYSCDFLLRRYIKRKAVRNRRKSSQASLSYKAFSYINNQY